MSDKKEFKPEDGKKYQPKTSMLIRAKLRLKMDKKKKMNESELFNNVRVGDTVHYSTPQGQSGKGKVVIKHESGSHVVVNRGKGQPQVVNDRNYIKHERGGKVIGALLSRLSQVKEASWQGANDPYNWDPVMRKLVFDAASKKNRAEQKKKGQPVPHELDTGRTLKSKPAPFRRGMKEDSHDAEGKSARVSKTKRLKKKLHELNTGTLASYVSKSIADRKKQQGMADMARRIYSPERSQEWVDKTTKKADKRSKGIKMAVGKIAKAYEARENEWAANQALSGQASKTAKGHYLMRDGRRLSGPHSPEDAVKQYKGMSDSKGVKIVHVKETHQFDVTHELMTEDKIKKAAKLAVDMKKKAKNNKHVDTEPKLDVADKGSAGAMEASTEGGDNAVKL